MAIASFTSLGVGAGEIYDPDSPAPCGGFYSVVLLRTFGAKISC